MDRFEEDRDAVVERALAAGVTAMLDVGNDLSSSLRVVENCEAYDSVFGAAGIHPHDAACDQDKLAGVKDVLAHPKVVALGEIGLDYHYDYSPRDLQKEVFEKQLGLARQMNLPVIIHVREAMADALVILDRFGDDPWRGVFHCFGGSVFDVPRVVERGFHISFTGVVTFKNYQGADMVRAVPAHRLLIETDAPFMAPVPHRGKRCEPAWIAQTARKLAEIRGEEFEILAEKTTENACQLFDIGT